MKRRTLFTLGILLSIQIFAQQRTETIDIIADASQMILPDIMQVNIDLKYTDKNEQQALNRLTTGINGQIQAIENAGFNKEKIKLHEFSIDELSEWVSNKSKITGYEAVQSVTITIPITEKETIDKLLNNLTINKNENISVRIDSKLSDKLTNEIKNALIKKAIFDAKEKALIMAESLNIKLGQVKSVEYGDLAFLPRLNSKIRFIAPIIKEQNSMVKQSNAYQLLGISETEIKEKIHVIWYIE
jgi:uncharacterized protein YggE